MEGVFSKQRLTVAYKIVGLISGAVFALLSGVMICTGEFTVLADLLWDSLALCFGFLMAVFCGKSLHRNRKAYFHADAQGITAYCQSGGALQCSFKDVSDVMLGYNTLHIWLKNCRKYSLTNLENAYLVAEYIRERIPEKPVTFGEEAELREAIPALREKCKDEGAASVCCYILLFPCILLTMGLTEGKELNEFTCENWEVFAGMALAGAMIITAAFLLLRRFLRHQKQLRKAQGELYQIVLRNSPVGPGNVRKLFLDSAEKASTRLTVYGYPDSPEVYFTVETVNGNYEIERVYESGIYADMDTIAPVIQELTEISFPL